MENRKRAVVLSGGGTKGAYEIGVWRALNELSIDYNIVTGTSIGSVNGALMAMGDYDKADEIWRKMTMTDFMDPPQKKTLPQEIAETFFMTKRARHKKLLKGAVNNSPFLDFIEKNIDEEQIRKSDIDYGLVTVRAKDRKAYFLPKKDIPKGLIKDYIIASSSVYPVFPMHKIENEYYIDGMYKDNLPIELALTMGAEDLIVVDLHLKPQHPEYAGRANVLYLTPSDELGGILEFDHKRIEKNIELGYQDTMRKISIVKR